MSRKKRNKTSTNTIPQRRRRLPLILHLFQHRLVRIQLIVFLPIIIHPPTIPAHISNDTNQRRQRQQQSTDPARKATTTAIKPRPKTCPEPQQEENDQTPSIEIQSGGSSSSSASLTTGVLRRRSLECNAGVGTESLLQGRR
jgi:hypothetical protein